ncbi:MAG: hypothetical protein IH999_11635 [Proteobacteria bacterium]|nr:hypothetical protein [Pseudomonadota bacterium]
MASLELKLLGRFEARLKGGPAIDLSMKKAKLLLSFLALPPGKAHPREKLAALLWSDRGDEQARHSLRDAISSLRKAFGDAEPSPLVADRETVSLGPAVVEVDAVKFEELVAAGTPEALERACALYRGELLEGETVRDPPFEEWLFYERERLYDLALQAFEKLLAYQQEAGANERAIETAQQLLKLKPAHEKTHRALMRLYADQERRAAALEQYQRCRAALKRELEVEPGPETDELYQQILRRSAKPRPVPPKLPPGEAPALELPDKPSIAVLPFKNLSGNPEQEYFVDGFTNEVITELSRFRNLFVIASNSVFTYKGKAVKVQQVARELGVQYVLEGSVQRVADRLRITAQLVDATTGGHVWAERYDRDAKDIFAVQEEVTQEIVATLGSRETGPVVRAGIGRAKRKPTDSLEAYDYYLLSFEHLDRFTKEDMAISRQLLEKAIELDPGFARAYAGLAWRHYFDWKWEWSESPAESADRAFEFAKKAVALDPSDGYNHYPLGVIYLWIRNQPEEGVAEYERALALTPNDADILSHWGWTLAFLGRAEEGVAVIQKAMRLNPHYPDGYLWTLGSSYYVARRYEEAIATLKKMPEQNPESGTYLAASYAQLGREAEARAVAAGILEADPDFSSARWAEKRPYKSQADRDHFLEGMRKAGLPE